MFDAERIARIVMMVVLVSLSAVIHEFAHAWMAKQLGDDTAERAGRLTLNPLKHIDPVGSVVLPLLLALSGGAIFSYAKPVPYNPNKLRHPGRDDALVALAGPVSNFLQALVGTLLLKLLVRVIEPSMGGEANALYYPYLFLYLYVYVNLSLGFFNLLPIPPLDGSKLILPFLQGDAKMTYYRIQSYAMPVFIAAVFLLPRMGIDPVGAYMDFTVGNTMNFLTSLV